MNGIPLIRQLVAQSEADGRPLPLMRELLASFDEERGAAIGATQRLEYLPPPRCEHCQGSGRVLEHADSCDDDQCGLDGGLYSCIPQVLFCSCAAGRRAALPPALRRCPWLAHPESQRRHDAEQFPQRRRRAYSRREWTHILFKVRLRATARMNRLRRAAFEHEAVLRRLLAEEPT